MMTIHRPGRVGAEITERFDQLTTAFASRFPRKYGPGPGVVALAATGLHQATAQDATPPAPTAPPPSALPNHLGLPEGERTSFLFVQTAAGGTWAPKDGEDGVYTLTLTGAAAQTVYFSDRPERIVGTQTTTQFLEALGFTPENPPNAALVTQTETGEDVLVIELLDPIYSEAFGTDGDVTLTYDARVLANYAGEGLAHLAERRGDTTMPAMFDAASLFIDDCSDALLGCYALATQTLVGTTTAGCCWSWSDGGCVACWDWTNLCSNQVPGCENGACYLYNMGKGCDFL